MRERGERYFVFSSPQAFNLLFLNLPLLSVCVERSRALDLKARARQGALVHPWLELSRLGANVGQERAQMSDKM